MHISSAILCAILVVSPTSQARQQTPKVVLEQWDAAYLPSGRAGYVHTVVEELRKDDQPIYRTTVELHLNVKRFNTQIELRMDTGTEETQDGKVTSVFMRHYLGREKKLDLQGIVHGKQLKLTLDRTKPLDPAPWDDRVVGLFRQQTMFKDRQVKAGDSFSYLSFEPSVNLVVLTKVKVKDYDEVEMFGGKTRRRLLRVETTPDPIQGVQLPTLLSWLDSDLQTIRSEVQVPGLGNLTLYRTTKEDALKPGSFASLTDIGINQFVRLNRRIVRPYEVESAVYRITVKEEENPETTFSRDLRQSVANVEKNSFELRVRNGPCEAATKVSNEFLQSSYFINCDDEKVRTLARTAVAGEKDSFKKALRIERWVRDHMRNRNHEAMATADHVARTLEGDCSEYAMLMAAMCRAEGIPSRTAIGLIYADVPQGPVFAFHMWTEVWIDGNWIPLDATLGRGFVGATHLKITDHSWHNVRSLTPMLPLLRVIGRVSVEVLEPRQTP